MSMQRQLPNYSSQTHEPSAPIAEVDQQELGSGISLTQLSTIAHSYWKVTAIIAVSVTILAAAVIKFLPKTYMATATLIVNTENKDPLASPTLPDNGLATYVATQTELILSPAILLSVVDRLNLTTDKDYAAGFRGGSADALRDYAEKALVTSIQVDEGRGGQLLYVSAYAKDPAKAAILANTVSDVFLDRQRQLAKGPAEERAQRYSEELGELRNKATAAQDKVAEFRRQNGITEVTANNNDTEQQTLAALENRLLDVQNQERTLQAKEAGVQSAADESLQSEQLLVLRKNLAMLNTQLAQDAQTLGPKHPKVLELKSQIDSTQKEITKAVGSLSANTDTNLSRIRVLEAELTKAVADQRTKLLRLRGVQDDGAKLQLEYESAQAVYKRALDGYDQIMFASAGDSGTVVSVVSRATPPVRPSKPNKIKLMFMGIFAGLALGALIPLGYELLLNRRLRCRDDIERSFGIPVLAEFDSMTPQGAAT